MRGRERDGRACVRDCTPAKPAEQLGGGNRVSGPAAHRRGDRCGVAARRSARRLSRFRGRANHAEELAAWIWRVEREWLSVHQHSPCAISCRDSTEAARPHGGRFGEPRSHCSGSPAAGGRRATKNGSTTSGRCGSTCGLTQAGRSGHRIPERSSTFRCATAARAKEASACSGRCSRD
jgi:hypothetical protein